MKTCPICKKAVSPDNPDYPFCGERCRLIDLGNWATDQYVIPGPEIAPQQEEE
jgi:hypothetical protein